jgi:hypothetical protein
VKKHYHRSNQHALGSNVGQFFEVLKNRQFGSLNISESKNRQFQFFEKYSESKNCPFKELFEKTSKNGWSS